MGASVTAVLGVFALVGLLIVAFGRPLPPGGAAAFQRPKPDGPTAQPPASRPAGPSPLGAAIVMPPTVSPLASTAETPTPKGYVVVYNQTRHRGLGTRVAADLERAGWRVVRVGNWVGNVPATTVYHPEGMRMEALALRDDFPHISRVRPAFPGIPDNALTVILAKDYPATLGDDAP
ncbi:tuberculin related peptide [Carbonactinospora thermoautotrophica]|uniref:Tuberculin related peptide n=1 Tax=Carbonactinospora thermoautotrophica TaxID=1469144 RepID=A0A132MYK2_9ACTN|nr:tuberculin related peptide [Carbonactinospora thermoautotrophica]